LGVDSSTRCILSVSRLVACERRARTGRPCAMRSELDPVSSIAIHLAARAGASRAQVAFADHESGDCNDIWSDVVRGEGEHERLSNQGCGGQ